ncbi:DUF350 domain-containing protein [Haloglycomyces albus]|uniref:DUF350 domain-containing protein n=1 Tax=Haloglycomyces albus TaxID=526067 RepID=UPI00046CD3EE|nr:DUF350 domain-containing protein [Haloglycomyces albus]
MYDNYLDNIIGAASYSLVGIALMIIGYFLVDLLTPGRIGTLIWTERNKNAALLLSSNILGIGIITVGAIWASSGNLVQGLAGTFTYGAIGLAAMAVAFLLLDALTPGKLGKIVTSEELHPAVWVTSTMHIAIGGVIAMALS